MDFKIPEIILREFVQIAKKNFSLNTHDPGHIETMAILVGHDESISDSKTVVSKLIFVDQIGAPYQVSSEGKLFRFFFILMSERFWTKIFGFGVNEQIRSL